MFCGPSAPPAPGRLSMMKRLPSWRAATSASARNAMSVLPPGVHGQINVIGRSGKASAVCARALLTHASHAIAQAANALERRKMITCVVRRRALHLQSHALDDSSLLVVHLLRELRIILAALVNVVLVEPLEHFLVGGIVHR